MKFLTFSMICVLSLAGIACNRDEGVRAGGEGDYQPRSAPHGVTAPGTLPNAAPTLDPGMASGTFAGQEMKGEFVRVDAAKKVMVIRVENGMEQTLKYDDKMTVTGMGAAQLKDLKPGSHLTLKWTGNATDKMVTSVNVTHADIKKK